MLSPQDIEDRRYTYVQAFFHYLGPEGTFFIQEGTVWHALCETQYFLVEPLAHEQAEAHAKEHIERCWPDRKLKSLHLYPGNYLRQARRLYREGKINEVLTERSPALLLDQLGIS